MDPQKQHSTEEIDLIYLANRLVRNTVAGIKTYLRILWHNIILCIAIFIAVALLGFLSKFVIARYYKTNAIFVAHYMPANMYGFLIDDLSDLAANSKNTVILAEKLRIPEQSAASIHSIETQPLNNQDFQYKNDTTSVNAFRVTLSLSRIEALQDVQDGLKNYLENNEYSVKKKSERKKMLTLIQSDLARKMKSLDSLQQIMNTPNMPKHSGQVIVMAQSFMPIEAYKIQQEYRNRQLQLDQELETIENIEIVQPFTKMAVQNSPDTNRLFKLSLLAGIVLALLLTPLLGRKR
jgi:capsular polysaccharide biosynthesis protein